MRHQSSIATEAAVPIVTKPSLEEFLESTPIVPTLIAQVSDPTSSLSLLKAKSDTRRKQVVELADQGLITQVELARILNAIDEAVKLAQNGEETALSNASKSSLATKRRSATDAANTKQYLYNLKTGWALQTPALESLQQARLHKEGGADVLFVIRRSTNRNVVVYSGKPGAGVAVKWIMFEKHNAPIEELTYLEKNTAYGTSVKKMATGTLAKSGSSTLDQHSDGAQVCTLHCLLL